MEREVIDEKFETIRKCIERIKEKTPENLKEFDKNIDAQDIVMLNLSRAIQAAMDIATHLLSTLEVPVPQTFKECFEVLAKKKIITSDLAEQLKKAVGFRNIATHEYKKIELRKIYTIAKKDILDLIKFMKAVDRWLIKKSDN